MPVPEIEKLEFADRLSRLSDEVLLTTEEAAIFLRVSISTLNKLRCTPQRNGPRYVQNCIPGTQGHNTVRYRLGDLKAWVTANTVRSTLEAFKKKSLP